MLTSDESSELWARAIAASTFTLDDIVNLELQVLDDLHKLIEEKLQESHSQQIEGLTARIPPDLDVEMHMDERAQIEHDTQTRGTTIRAMLLYQAVGILEQDLRETCVKIEAESLRLNQDSSQLKDLRGPNGVDKYLRYLGKVLSSTSGEVGAALERVKHFNHLRNWIMHTGFTVPESQKADQKYQGLKSAVAALHGVTLSSSTGDIDISIAFAPWMLDQVRECRRQLFRLRQC